MPTGTTVPNSDLQNGTDFSIIKYRQVCQIRARHGSHPELHTTRQVSDVMGMTGLCIGTAQTQSVGLARQALRHASLGFVSVQTGTAQS